MATSMKLVLSLLLLATPTISHAETIVIGKRVANILTTQEIYERIQANSVAEREFFVCKCQVNKNFLNITAPGNTTLKSASIRLENAGTSGFFDTLLHSFSVPVNIRDVKREIKIAAKKDCFNSSFSHCKVNILLVRLPGPYADVDTLHGVVQRPKFHVVIDWTGGTQTFLESWAKNTTSWINIFFGK